jgi:hypothetical protein
LPLGGDICWRGITKPLHVGQQVLVCNAVDASLSGGKDGRVPYGGRRRGPYVPISTIICQPLLARRRFYVLSFGFLFTPIFF